MNGDDLLRVAQFVQIESDVGILLFENPHRCREDLVHRRTAIPDSHFRKEHVPRRGPANTIGIPLEEVVTDLALEFTHLCTERLLCHVETLRRSTEVQLLGYRDETSTPRG